MNWEKLDIHIENLAPGLATVWAISLNLQLPAIDSDIEKVMLGLSLLGVAYMTGVVVNLLCRLFLDPVSEHWTRIFVFKVFTKEKLRDQEGASREDLNNAYNYYCTKAIQEAKETAKEVAKRRQTGRLLRSALVPLLIVLWHLHKTDNLVLWLTIILIFVEYFVMLILYGYAEATILHEAYHAVPEEDRSVMAIKRMLESKRKNEGIKP